MIAIYIARRDLQAAGRANNENRLPPGPANLQLDPVVGARDVASSNLHAGQVWNQVPVEVRHGKLQARSNRGRNTPGVRSGRCTRNQAGKK